MWKLLIFIHSLFFLHKVLLSLWVSLVYQFNLILSKNNNHIVITVILQISFFNLFPQLKLLKHYWIKVETLVDLIWFPKGLPGWLSWYIICMQCGRPEFDPRVGKIPGRREQLPTPVFLPGECLWTEEPGGLQSMGLSRVGHDWAIFTSQCQPSSRNFLCLEAIKIGY